MGIVLLLTNTLTVGLLVILIPVQQYNYEGKGFECVSSNSSTISHDYFLKTDIPHILI